MYVPHSYRYMYMKAVGNRPVLRDKMSSRTFCASIQEVDLVSHLGKTRSPNAARIPLDFAPLSARGGHTNRHSECCPAQGVWPSASALAARALQSPPRAGAEFFLRYAVLVSLDNQSLRSGAGHAFLLVHVRSTSPTPALPGAFTNLTNWEQTTSDAFRRRERPTSSSNWLVIHGPVRPWFSTWRLLRGAIARRPSALSMNAGRCDLDCLQTLICGGRPAEI